MADPLNDSPIYQQMLSYLQNRKVVPKQSKDFVNDVRPLKNDILAMIEEQFTAQSMESKRAADQFTVAHRKLRSDTPAASTPAFSVVGMTNPNRPAGQSHSGATAATETLLLLDLATRASGR